MKSNRPQIPPILYFHAIESSKESFKPEMLEASVFAANPGTQSEFLQAVTYREYLEFIKNFLVSRWTEVVEVLKELSGQEHLQIDVIEIVAEKSGSDYHPASVRFTTPLGQIPLVANVAVTPRGRSRLRRDFELLRDFWAKGEGRFLPQPYLINNEKEFMAAESDDSMVMFLGQWLEGFYEFHLTRLTEDEELAVVVWDMESGLKIFSVNQARDIYKQTAFILTHYFDLNEYKEIFPWHHAAGDFITRLGPTLQVKLITVRQYAPRIQSDRDFKLDPYEAALLFFCNLTIRNRVDRLDGVGEMVWGPNGILEATVAGFFDSLKTRENVGSIEEGFSDRLISICKKLDLIAWTQLFDGTLESFSPNAPDYGLIENSLPEHIFEVYQLFHR